MRLAIRHTTRYVYPSPITETHMEMRLRPGDGGGQRVDHFELDVRPAAPLRSYVDGYGNHAHHFNHLPPHREVELTSYSVVDTTDDGERSKSRDRGRGEPRPCDFLRFRAPVVDSPRIRQLAARHPVRDPESPGAVTAALEALTRTIAEEFEYRPQTTTVSTGVDEVLELRSGVCQDFAHLLVAVARSAGVPTRYVSGYIYTGSGEPVTGASHAWAEAWVPAVGWVGYDATHPVRASERHVRVATGRDYHDAAPTRGVYVGAVRAEMEVRVETRIIRPR